VFRIFVVLGVELIYKWAKLVDQVVLQGSGDDGKAGDMTSEST